MRITPGMQGRILRVALGIFSLDKKTRQHGLLAIYKEVYEKTDIRTMQTRLLRGQRISFSWLSWKRVKGGGR
jgi:hypothetical protein